MTLETSQTRQANILHILPQATIRRDRMLPAPGRVLVRKGQQVDATDVVAEGEVAARHLLIDLVRGLGMPADRAEKHLQVKVGDRLEAGDVIAGPVGRTQRVVRAPQKGQVILVGAGRVLLDQDGSTFSLKAGLPGLVSELIADRGVTIETTGGLLQGVWGNGWLDAGPLQVLAGTAGELLRPGQIAAGLQGAVVLGGRVEKAETLKNAAELPVRGLILGSLEPDLLQEAERLLLPIVLLEGFTHQPVNPAVYEMLTAHAGREVVINAERRDPYAGTRPEIIIPLPGEAPSEPVETLAFETGQMVRVVRAPSAGQWGTLGRLAGMSTFPSGVRALAGEVWLQNGDTVLIPLANLEVIG